MYQYILFDLDGTLTDPKIGICKSVQYALNAAGIIEDNLDSLEPFIGPPLKDSFMQMYHMSSEEAEKAIEKYRERFSVTGLYENDIYPGIRELLSHLKAAGKKLAIASSKPTVFVEQILKHFEIYEYFAVVVGSELDGRRGKKEEVVEEALHRLLGKEKEHYKKCVMVGDRKYDVEGAKAFGIDSIGVSYGYGGREELKQAGVTYLVNQVGELDQLLLSKATKRESIVVALQRTLESIGPIVVYWLLTNSVMILLLSTLNSYSVFPTLRNSVWMNAIGSIVALPYLWKTFRKNQFLQKKIEVQSFWNIRYLLLIIMGGSSALFLNMILSYIEFPKILNDYNEVAAVQYSVSIAEGILIYGLIMPLAEELLFRGIVFGRMKRYIRAAVAIPVSAFIFGIYHGNAQQAVYGFLMGCLMAYFYWLSEEFVYPFIIHSAANIIVFTITFNGNAQTHINTPLNCFIFAIISIITFFMLTKRENN